MKEFIFNEKVSKIVVSNEEINFLKEIIPNSKFSLLYRATIDGDSFKTFHSKVDGKAPTIILFKTSKDKKWVLIQIILGVQMEDVMTILKLFIFYLVFLIKKNI